MEKIVGVAWIIYLIIGCVQLGVIHDFFHIHWGWPWLLAGIPGLFFGFFPIVGSICGMIGATVVWHWHWWQAALLFFWPIPLFLLYGGAGWVGNFFRKEG